ncbi:LytR/AlgR family response regulator transcription factor [Clostridium sp. DL1XJH146]
MNCIIVDDEYPAREELKYFINNFSSIKKIGEFDNSVKALAFIEKEKPDIVFLDINMPSMDGITLGRILNSFEKDIKIIFITAYKEHAVDAFEIKAFDYILKPYSEDRIIKTLKRLETNSKKIGSANNYNYNYSNDKITLWKDNKMIVINVQNILYCEVHDRETYIYTKEGRYSENCSISEFYNKLPQNIFFRNHRSYIINIDRIKEIIPWFNNTYMIKFEGIEEDIPVSRSNICDFKRIMGI